MEVELRLIFTEGAAVNNTHYRGFIQYLHTTFIQL